jgi:hypothetical protein
MNNKLAGCIVIMLITLSSCSQDNSDDETIPLTLDGRWWVVGHYSGDCGDRGPWNAHLDIVQNDHELEMTSIDMDGGPYHEIIQLDENYSYTTSSSTIDGTATETRTRSLSFTSSSAFTGSSTLVREDGANSCQTTNINTGIKLESAHLDNLSNGYCLITKLISTDPTSPELTQVALQLYPTNEPAGINFATTGGSVQFSGNGTIVDERIQLNGSTANGMSTTMLIAIARESTELNGTIMLDFNAPGSVPMSGSITGYEGSCWQQPIPQADPADIMLPMNPLGNIIGFQVYGLPDHDGIDFVPNQTLLPVYASTDGMVTALNRDYPHNGTLVQSVRINYNEDYYIAINFEPYTDDVLIASQQKDNITVQLMQHVNKGDVIGYLVVPGNTGFPHIHWGIGQSSSATTLCPSDFLSVAEQTTFENYVVSIKGQGSCP